MNKKTTIWFSCLFALLFSSLSHATDAYILYPEIAFTYDWRSRALDLGGAILPFGRYVNSSEQHALKQELPTLIQAWHDDAPDLFGEVFAYFKRGFQTKNITALINLSHRRAGFFYFYSLKFIVLGLSSFLEKNIIWTSTISDEEHFTSLVFHELLHLWLFENMAINKSPLLEKYKYEHHHVQSHIHLMAIEKMVYLKLNRPDMVDMLAELYSKPFFPIAYKRAWEIVNDIEGHEAVIQDILESLA